MFWYPVIAFELTEKKWTSSLSMGFRFKSSVSFSFNNLCIRNYSAIVFTLFRVSEVFSTFAALQITENTFHQEYGWFAIGYLIWHIFSFSLLKELLSSQIELSKLYKSTYWCGKYELAWIFLLPVSDFSGSYMLRYFSVALHLIEGIWKILLEIGLLNLLLMIPLLPKVNPRNTLMFLIVRQKIVLKIWCHLFEIFHVKLLSSWKSRFM